MRMALVCRFGLSALTWLIDGRTGHGVGSFLNVHEGPANISPREGSNKVALKAGMVLSNGEVKTKPFPFWLTLFRTWLLQRWRMGHSNRELGDCQGGQIGP
jgi:Xaa-Pro aminopeptidase